MLPFRYGGLIYGIKAVLQPSWDQAAAELFGAGTGEEIKVDSVKDYVLKFKPQTEI